MTRRIGRPSGRRSYGSKIRRLRVDRGLTVVQLAGQIGRHPETVRRTETESRPISDVFASRLARALGVKMSDISDWDDGTASEPETPDRISA